MIKRKLTKQVKVGNVKIGGTAPISVQSMVKSKTTKAIIGEIHKLESAGCDLIRLAVPDFENAKKIKLAKKETSIPIIGDIHYNFQLAIEAVKQGADKIRINPGNIGGKTKVKEIIKCLKDYSISMRVGVNSGSLESDLLQKYEGVTAPALAESIFRWVKIIEDFDFNQMVLSVKSSDPRITIDAYRLVSKKLDYPLHLGVTAASGGMNGIVRSTVGIGTLLAGGIGDTIRVSLTGDSKEEIEVGKEILRSLGLRNNGIQIIACPTCGRCEIDVKTLVQEVEKKLNSVGAIHELPLRIAVMGCIVNGPGEARDVEFGVTGSRNKGVIFKNGKIIKKVAKDKIVDTLLEEICKE